MRLGKHTMMTKQINFDHMLLDMGAPNQKQFFKNVASTLARKTGLGENSLLLKLVSQEKNTPSAIGNGVALSHLQFSEIKEPQMVFVRLKNSIEAETPDNLPVDIFCIVLSSRKNTGEGLQLVSSLSRILSDPFLCDQLKCLRSIEEIHSMMNERQIIRRAA